MLSFIFFTPCESDAKSYGCDMFTCAGDWMDMSGIPEDVTVEEPEVAYMLDVTSQPTEKRLIRQCALLKR